MNGMGLDPGSGRTNNNIQRPSECLLLAQSGHRAAEFQCLLLGVKRTSHGHALMSAGRRSLKGRAARKRTASKKIADTGGVSFFRFQKWARGRGWVYMPIFPITGAILLL